MKLLLQFLIIFAFWEVGEGVSCLCNGAVPGSLIGMILLFAALSTNLLKSSWVDRAAAYFSKYMVALFLPSAVGIMVVWSQLSEHIVPVILIILISTALTMVLVALIYQKLNKR